MIAWVATVKLLEFVLARNVKEQMVRYVQSFAVKDQFYRHQLAGLAQIEYGESTWGLFASSSAVSKDDFKSPTEGTSWPSHSGRDSK
jgi:hypothetical protein